MYNAFNHHYYDDRRMNVIPEGFRWVEKFGYIGVDGEFWDEAMFTQVDSGCGYTVTPMY